MKARVVVLGVIVISVGASLLVFNLYSNRDSRTIAEFAASRNEVDKWNVYSIVGFTPDSLENPLPLCDRYSDYADYMKKDSRQMTVAELNDAILLSDECGPDVNRSGYETSSEFSARISDIVGIASKFKNPEYAEIAQKIVADWRQIGQLTSEKVDIESAGVDIMKSYWTAELGYKSEIDSFQQRQSQFVKLNEVVERNLTRGEEIISERKTLLTDERDQWSIFKAKTGYVEDEIKDATTSAE